eukprot:CAMPEP_0119467478 /NCGR_PEP_ID=MMETSP1344-20130328/1646_1 /TAXON_ID=236787 /ORGANISM="Florenciella parvula, Strain CCMP2471" /LENGTH=97 /DNA_ID=CAMNT_0007499847 /DNA_START=29 /DNA_END=323 /DNA_ORIENTATION=-
MTTGLAVVFRGLGASPILALLIVLRLGALAAVELAVRDPHVVVLVDVNGLAARTLVLGRLVETELALARESAPRRRASHGPKRLGIVHPDRDLRSLD